MVALAAGQEDANEYVEGRYFFSSKARSRNGLWIVLAPLCVRARARARAPMTCISPCLVFLFLVPEKRSKSTKVRPGRTPSSQSGNTGVFEAESCFLYGVSG